MQATSVLNSMDFAEISSKMSEDFSAKLKFEASDSEELASESAALEEKDVYDEEEEEVDEDEEEFSFVCLNPDGSPISAEDIFQNGQIRPVFPIFDRALLFADAEDSGDSASGAAEVSTLRPPLKKLFIEERGRPSSSSSSDAEELEGVQPGTYCEWSGKAVEASPEMSKKSNSTGFSRLWRFRDSVTRSSSDGKDAFVFLNPNSTSAKPSVEAVKRVVKAEKTEKPAHERKVLPPPPLPAAKAKVTTKRGETAPSAHEKHYVRNRAKKEVDKRRSYLPYRPDLVGFFTNVNGLSRNVHPF